MNLVAERAEYDAAGALAEELPWWGYLTDDRTCLTRDGQLLCVGRITPSPLDGRTPKALDAVLERWTRLLSNVEPGGRLHFYLLRRPVDLGADASDDGDSVSAIARRRRKAFLAETIARRSGVSGLVSRSGIATGHHRPHGRGTVVAQLLHAPGSPETGRLMRLSTFTTRSRPRRLAFPAACRCGFEARLRPDRDRSVERTGRGPFPLSELVNRPGLPWDGALSSGLNWSLAVSELDAERRFLRLDGEPVVLYSLLSPPGAARANMLNDLYRLRARMTVSLEWRPYTTEAGRKKINSARKHYFSQRYSMMAHVQETEGSAVAMEDSVASAESDRLSKGPGRAGNRWHCLWRHQFVDRACMARLPSHRAARRRSAPDLCHP